MNKVQIIKKVIDKAVENGYKIEEHNKCFFDEYIDFEYPYLYYHEEYVASWVLHINEIIFSHDFAKAFWKQKTPKECKYCNNEGGYFDMVELGCHFGAEKQWVSCSQCNGKSRKKDYIWRMKLREMVTEKEPLKYLEGFLDERFQQTNVRNGK